MISDVRQTDAHALAAGGQEATAAVASCEEALAQFETEALSEELGESGFDSRPGLRAVEGGND